ncbi:MAG TPA: ATP synthase F0 subunit B [Candidatus Acidoferrales bacterium]
MRGAIEFIRVDRKTGAASSAPTVLPKLLCAVASIALMAAPVMAQETGDVTTTTTGWVFRWINFAIIFGLIAWGFSKAGPYFRKTADQISQKIAEGKRAREAAENQRRMVQEKMSHLDAEVAQLRADAKRANEGEAQRIRAMAKEEAQNIERAGHAEIAAAERQARLELKAFAGRVAVEQAEVILREQMTASTEAAVFRTFVESLDGSRN